MRSSARWEPQPAQAKHTAGRWNPQPGRGDAPRGRAAAGLLTLLGTGGSHRNASFLYRHIILRALAPMVPDKETQERVVRDSGLQWVLVRPPRFVSRRRGQLRVLREGDCGRIGHVARQDLAAVLLDAAERPRLPPPGDRRMLVDPNPAISNVARRPPPRQAPTR